MSRARALLRLVTDGRRRYSQSSRVITDCRDSLYNPWCDQSSCRQTIEKLAFDVDDPYEKVQARNDVSIPRIHSLGTEKFPRDFSWRVSYVSPTPPVQHLMAADYGSENPSKLVELCAEFICRNLDKFTAKSPNGTPFLRTPFILPVVIVETILFKLNELFIRNENAIATLLHPSTCPHGLRRLRIPGSLVGPTGFDLASKSCHLFDVNLAFCRQLNNQKILDGLLPSSRTLRSLNLGHIKGQLGFEKLEEFRELIKGSRSIRDRRRFCVVEESMFANEEPSESRRLRNTHIGFVRPDVCVSSFWSTIVERSRTFSRKR